MKPLIYVAGPYTGENIQNTRRAILVAEQIRTKFDVNCFVPHLTAMYDLVAPNDWKYWMELDINILSRCDFLYRMVGASKGADMEVAYANDHDIPVRTTFMGLRDWLTAHAQAQ